MKKKFNISDLPTEIPIFPLSNAIFFPKTLLPLNIFEPRYIFGQDSAFTSDETAMEVTLVGKQARRGLFNAD